VSLSWIYPDARAKDTKVFWFFFSKKNRFLPLQRFVTPAELTPVCRVEALVNRFGIQNHAPVPCAAPAFAVGRLPQLFEQQPQPAAADHGGDTRTSVRRLFQAAGAAHRLG
jgi:hypothetical protein